MLVRAARVILLLVVAALTVSLVVSMGSSGTGPVEKIVLVALIAACVVLAAKLTSVATAVEKRLHPH
ncbi:MAG: hypothetical protein H0U61_02410 [Nocardioidaceae bacterium]|nr:hypothetical protein [Nocardioidaceae bacterium]